MTASVPGGFAAQGRWQRTLRLRPLTGWDEVELFGGSGECAAAQVTRLLSRCVFLDAEDEPVGPDFVRDLTVGDREALLLQLRARSVGEAFPCVLDCPACGEKMELELRADALLTDPYPHGNGTHTLRLEGGDEEPRKLVFRLPTGGDQEAVAALAASDPEGAARALADRCLVVSGEGDEPATEVLTTPVLTSLSERMSSLDPQAEIVLLLACPECDEECRAVFDSFAYLKAEMEGARARLDAEVHLLAYHYHWSEAEILAMPGARRRRYAEQLRDSLEARAS